MEKKIFHIIIFSRLQSYDGGRETWLNMFLPMLSKKIPNSIINIYFFSDKESDKKKLIRTYYNNDKKFNFNEIYLTNTTNKFSSLYRIFNFSLKVIRLIKRNNKKSFKENENYLLAIGSFYEGFVLLLYKITSIFRIKNKIKYFVWLRSIWSKQSLVLHSGFVHSLVVRIEKIILKNANIIIANGNDTAVAYKDLGFEPVLINNAIDLNRFKKISPLVDKDIKVISYIGRLSKEKGLLDFLKSIEYFNANYPDLKNKIQFEIVGDGPLREQVKIAKCDNLIFRGLILNENITSYLESISCGVALTYSKNKLGGAGISNGLLELIASGRGVICWDGPAFTQILDEKSAFLIKESSIKELALSYRKVIENFNEVTQKNANLKLIIKDYSQEVHIEKFCNIINN
jgi:glycosyltransferase involved in cell wall biosynthesis